MALFFQSATSPASSKTRCSPSRRPKTIKYNHRDSSYIQHQLLFLKIPNIMISIQQQSSRIGWKWSSDLLKLSTPIRSSIQADFRQLRHIQQATRTGVSHTPKSSRNSASIKGTVRQSQKGQPAHSWNQPFSPRSCSIPSNHLISHRITYSTASTISTEPIIHDIFEPTSGTWQYLIADPSTSTAVIIDPVLNYDPATQAVTTQAADSLLALIKGKGYKIDKILETHAHADHLSAASYLQKHLAQHQAHKPPICIGKRIEQVQKLFAERYGVPREEYKAIFDRLFDDDETFTIGNLKGKAIHLPGHTPDHLGYMIGGTYLPSMINLLHSYSQSLFQIIYSAATLFSMWTSALHAVTSPVAMPMTSFDRAASF